MSGPSRRPHEAAPGARSALRGLLVRWRTSAPGTLAPLAPLCLAALLQSGCQLPYLVSQLAGETRLLASARPVDEVRADPETSPELARRLAEAEEILEFARQEGFRVGDAYETYAVPPEGAPVWIVSATPPDRLEPVEWSFPIIGAFPYKGFFRRSIAEAEARRLADAGFEVDLRPASAFSTLGWFPDPLLPTLLDGDAADRAAGILHELAHRTVFVPGDARLNESVATSIEDRGVAAWLAGRGDPELVLEHARRSRDRERLREAVAATIAELRIGFEAPTREERLAARERTFAGLAARLAESPFETERYRRTRTLTWTLPALLLHDVYGGDGPLLDRVWTAAAGSVRGYLGLLTRAARADDPREELERLASPPDLDVPGNAPRERPVGEGDPGEEG